MRLFLKDLSKKERNFLAIFPVFFCVLVIVAGILSVDESGIFVNIFGWLASLLTAPINLFKNPGTSLLGRVILLLPTGYIYGLIALLAYKIIKKEKVVFKNYILIFACYLTLFIFIQIFLPSWDRYDMEKKGDVIITKIEEYKKEHGRLPENLGELGIYYDETTQPYYNKRNGNEYDLQYIFGFDSGYGYFSETGNWRYTY